MQVEHGVLDAMSVDVRAFARVQKLAVAGLIWTIGVLVLGTLLMTLNLGEACVGWPMCNGGLHPPEHTEGLLAFGHRLGGLGLMVIVGVLALVSHRQLKQHVPDRVVQEENYVNEVNCFYNRLTRDLFQCFR